MWYITRLTYRICVSWIRAVLISCLLWFCRKSEKPEKLWRWKKFWRQSWRQANKGAVFICYLVNLVNLTGAIRDHSKLGSNFEPIQFKRSSTHKNASDWWLRSFALNFHNVHLWICMLSIVFDEGVYGWGDFLLTSNSSSFKSGKVSNGLISESSQTISITKWFLKLKSHFFCFKSYAFRISEHQKEVIALKTQMKSYKRRFKVSPRYFNVNFRLRVVTNF